MLNISDFIISFTNGSPPFILVYAINEKNWPCILISYTGKITYIPVYVCYSMTRMTILIIYKSCNIDL